ncbi:MAG: alpha/beta fold hydrolase, partial [Polyangiales bacterium]
ALFAHCFTCSKDLNAARRITEGLADAGLAVLRFDFTGLGQSAGDFADTHFSSNVADLLAAAAYLREHHRAPQLLVGHSLGGAAALQAAAVLPECRAVATVGAPYDPAHVTHLLAQAEAEIRQHGEAKVTLAGRSFCIRQSFLDDLQKHDPKDMLARLGRALLVLHAPQDTLVGIDNAQLIYEAARHPKSFVSLDGADHLLTRRADADYVATVLAAWATRYVEDERTELPRSTDRHVSARRRGEGLFVELRAGQHGFGADEPVHLGSGDRAPTPYGLLLGALGACTAMTLELYGRRKGWLLQEVRVELEHSRAHRTDCDGCEDNPARIERITRTLHLEGELTAEQQQRLLEIADRCPVHRTLEGELHIESVLGRALAPPSEP